MTQLHYASLIFLSFTGTIFCMKEESSNIVSLYEIIKYKKELSFKENTSNELTYKLATSTESLLIEKYDRTYKEKLGKEGALLFFSMAFKNYSQGGSGYIANALRSKSKMVEAENDIKKDNLILSEIVGYEPLAKKVQEKLMSNEHYKKRKITTDSILEDIENNYSGCTDRQELLTGIIVKLNELLQNTDWKPTLKEVIAEEYKK